MSRFVYNLVKYNAAADQLELYLKDVADVADVETIKKLIKQFRDKASSSNLFYKFCAFAQLFSYSFRAIAKSEITWIDNV